MPTTVLGTNKALRARQLRRFLDNTDSALKPHRDLAGAEMERCDPGLKALAAMASSTPEQPEEPAWLADWERSTGVLGGYIKKNFARWVAEYRGGDNEGDSVSGDSSAGEHLEAGVSGATAEAEAEVEEHNSDQGRQPRHSGVVASAGDVESVFETRAAETARRRLSVLSLSSAPQRTQNGIEEQKTSATNTAIVETQTKPTSPSPQPSSKRHHQQFQAPAGSPDPYLCNRRKPTAQEQDGSQGLSRTAAREVVPPLPVESRIDEEWYRWYRETRGHGHGA